MNEHEAVLRQRIYLRRLPHTFDKVIDLSLNSIEPMLSNQVLDQDRRASLMSNYSKTITQYKYDLMTLNLDTIQSIMRGHQEILNDLQGKLSQLSCDDQIIQTIQNRQQTTRERHELYLQHKLKTFFDEALTTFNE